MIGADIGLALPEMVLKGKKSILPTPTKIIALII
jgi:hypothetical protein